MISARLCRHNVRTPRAICTGEDRRAHQDVTEELYKSGYQLDLVADSHDIARRTGSDTPSGPTDAFTPSAGWMSGSGLLDAAWRN